MIPFSVFYLVLWLQLPLLFCLSSFTRKHSVGNVVSSAGNLIRSEVRDVGTPTQKGHTRAAFCLSGHPRSFVLPAVHLSIQKNLINAFGAPDSRVFWYFKLKRDYAKAEAASVLNESDLTAARDVMQPVQVVYDYVHESDASSGICSAAVEGQYGSIDKCYQMVLQDEKSRNLPYDYVFRVRPDVAWVRRFPSYDQYDDSLHEVSIIRDWFLVTKRKFADMLFMGPTHCASQQETGETVMAERILASGAKVRFQCGGNSQDRFMCEHDMHAGWIVQGLFANPLQWWASGPADPKTWASEWSCLSPLWLIRLHSGRNKWVDDVWSSPLNMTEAQKNNLMSTHRVSDLVDTWHSRPMCSGFCHDLVAQGEIQDSKHLGACEERHPEAPISVVQQVPSASLSQLLHASAVHQNVANEALLSCISFFKSVDMNSSGAVSTKRKLCREMMVN